MVLTKVDERQDLYEPRELLRAGSCFVKVPADTQQELVKASKGQDVTDYIDSRRTLNVSHLSRMELGLSVGALLSVQSPLCMVEPLRLLVIQISRNLDRAPMAIG